MTDRGFTHPNFGREARIEQYGKEVHLVFVASTHEQADSMCDLLITQLKDGALNITLLGKPTKIVEE